MCRLAFLPASHGLSASTLESFFAALERSCGGQGMGLSAHDQEGNCVHLCKGLRVSARGSSKRAVAWAREGLHCLFHTRLVSVGHQSDGQCHPFHCSGRFTACTVAHNGTWREGEIGSRFMRLQGWQDLSDSKLFALLYADYGPSRMRELRLWPGSGVWMVITALKGRFTVYHESGDLRYHAESGIYASEFPGSFGATVNVGLGKHGLLKPPRSVQADPVWRSTVQVGTSAWATGVCWAAGCSKPRIAGGSYCQEHAKESGGRMCIHHQCTQPAVRSNPAYCAAHAVEWLKCRDEDLPPEYRLPEAYRVAWSDRTVY